MIVSKSLNELHRLIDMKEATYTTPVRFYFSDGPKETTIGRLFIWEISGYLPEKEIDKKESAKIVSHINNNYTPEVAGRRLHKLQQFGFHKATMSGLSLCYDDTKFDFGIDFPAMTQELGKMGYEDRLAAADKVINECTDRWFKEVDRHNPLYAMGVSGARVSPPQVRSMVVAKGLLVGMTGKIMPMPIMENLSSGLSPINYFNTCGPARKGLAGNFFLVPATGWFARQLVNCSRELSIVEEDCGTREVITLPKKSALYRFTSDRVMVTKENVDQLADEEGNVKVLSPITCESTKGGVCQHCCGMDPAKPANFFPINFGIGTASAQHISEPSTQAGLRGKHCVLGETVVEDINGNKKTILEIEKDLESGKDFYVHSSDNDNNLQVGKVIKVWQERWDDKMAVVTLDNGEVIKCTTDHPFLDRSGVYVEAAKLKEGQSLMPYYTGVSDGYRSVRSGGKYIRGYKLSAQRPECGNIYDGNGSEQIHHLDFAKGNDYPSNLIKLSAGQHINIHRTKVLEELNSGERDMWVGWDKNPEAMQRVAEHNQEPWRLELSSRSISEWIKENPEHHSRNAAKGIETQSKLWGTQWGKDLHDKVFRTKCINSVNRAIESGNFNLNGCNGTGLPSLNLAYESFPDLFTNEYPWHWECSTEMTKMEKQAVSVMNKVKEELAKLGYPMSKDNYEMVAAEIWKSDKFYGRNYDTVMSLLPDVKYWKEYVHENNHKVVSVEIVDLGVMTPFYDLEVDSEYHNYPIGGVFVHNTSGSTTLKEFGTSVSNTLADILKTVGGRGTAVAQVSESKYKCITDLAHETGSAIKGAELAAIQLKHIFDDIGIGIASIHHEIIARGCTDLVKMNNGRIGVRSMGDKGEVLAIKADAIPTKHPSWLKSIGHGNVKQRLTSAVLNGDVSFGTRSEMIIAGLNLNNK